jgi:hypothetical protein
MDNVCIYLGSQLSFAAFVRVYRPMFAQPIFISLEGMCLLIQTKVGPVNLNHRDDYSCEQATVNLVIFLI